MSFQSQAIISAAAGRFGTIDYSRWQAIRWQWYSYVPYPVLGSSVINFFGNVAGQPGFTLADTNLPKAGSFGQTHFLLKTISTAIKLPENDLDLFTAANGATADANTLSSDLLNGFAQAGVLEFNIGARPFATLVKPFLYAPPPGNEPDFANAYVAQSDAGGNASVAPYVTQTRLRSNVYVCDPNILIEAEQQFEVKLSFPSDPVPVIGTDVIDDEDVATTLKIGVILDGVLLRPMQ